MLSILIPTYNNACPSLITSLAQQATDSGIDYEIIVAEDGSTDNDTITANHNACSVTEKCLHIVRKQNVGRASIRNFLASTAQYNHLIFIDSSMDITSGHFIANYLNHIGDAQVICGGFELANTNTSSLRYRYEQHFLETHTLEYRREKPYNSFRTNNFAISKQVYLQTKLDETIATYGYEDVLFGAQLQKKGISILQIHNPTVYIIHDCNTVFISKTEESLTTLHTLRLQLQNHSGIISMAHALRHIHPLLRAIFHLTKQPMKHLLINYRTPLFIFHIYRLLFYISLR